MISAPVRLADMSVQARTVWVMAASAVRTWLLPKILVNGEPVPSRSRKRRISGWNSTTRASKPI